MATLQQSLKKSHASKGRLIRTAALKGCPQKRGFVVKVNFLKPKKPNSANRRFARIRLTTFREIRAYVVGREAIPPLQEHGVVLVRGGHKRDLPGMHYRLIKGKYDFMRAEQGLRLQARSKYGMSNPFITKRLWKKHTKGRKKRKNKQLRKSAELEI